MSDPLIESRVLSILADLGPLTTNQVLAALRNTGYFGTNGRAVWTLNSSGRVARCGQRWTAVQHGVRPAPHPAEPRPSDRTSDGRCAHVGRCHCRAF